MGLFSTNASPQEDWMGAVNELGLEEAKKRYPAQYELYGLPGEVAKTQLDILGDQQDIYKSAYEQNQLLQPLLLQQAGIIPKYDDAGNIVGYELAPESEEQRLLKELSTTALQGQVDYQTKQNELLSMQLSDFQANQPLRAATEAATLERTLAALEGRLPVDPSLMDELALEERNLEERFSAQLGPGYQTSSPYIEAKNDFIRTKEATLEAARRGEITTLGALGFGMGDASARNAYGAPQTGLNAYATRQDDLQRLLGNTSSVSAQPLQYGSAYGGAAAGLSNPLGYYQGQQQIAYDAYKTSVQNEAAAWGSIFGAAGQIGGMAFGDWLYGDRD